MPSIRMSPQQADKLFAFEVNRYWHCFLLGHGCGLCSNQNAYCSGQCIACVTVLYNIRKYIYVCWEDHASSLFFACKPFFSFSPSP